ncbi:hypothetical protein BASA60_010832 [Batrachochytrium salamandrivorans]|nr:hypothetical protein BASA60_010832 [Batrachochytrium salamandrivorans]
MPESSRLRSSRLQQLETEVQLQMQQQLQVQSHLQQREPLEFPYPPVKSAATAAALTAEGSTGPDLLVSRTHSSSSSNHPRSRTQFPRNKLAALSAIQGSSANTASSNTRKVPGPVVSSANSANAFVCNVPMEPESTAATCRSATNSVSSAYGDLDIHGAAIDKGGAAAAAASAFGVDSAIAHPNASPVHLDSLLSVGDARSPIQRASNGVSNIATASVPFDSQVPSSNNNSPSLEPMIDNPDISISPLLVNGSNQGSNATHIANEATPSLLAIKNKLRSHGPYTRIYSRLDQLVATDANGGSNKSKTPLSAPSADASRTVLFGKSHSSSATGLPGFDVERGNAKDLSVLEISSSRMNIPGNNVFAYPSVIRAPPNINRVTVGTAFSLPHSSLPSQMTLARPVASRQGPRYARSSTASRSSRSNNLSQSSTPTHNRQGTYFQGQFSQLQPTIPEFPKDDQYSYHPRDLPSTPLLPFLSMSNSLQLYLKMNVLGISEGIINWIPGSYLTQIGPFVESAHLSSRKTIGSAASRLFGIGAIRSFVKSLSSSDIISNNASQPISPGYLLLTTSAVYIFRPNFSLFNLKIPLRDEQTSYVDPSGLLELVCSFAHHDIARADVGPTRQYLCFRVVSSVSASSKISGSMRDLSLAPISTNDVSDMQSSSASLRAKNEKSVSARSSNITKIVSWVFLAGSRASTTQIVDCLTTRLHDLRNTLPMGNTINQDIESTLRNLQTSVFLRRGPKDLRILSYAGVWAHNTPPSIAISSTTSLSLDESCNHAATLDPLHTLSDEEQDRACLADITKVDFDFVRLYVLGCFLRYIRPMAELSERTVKLEHISVIGTEDYIYVSTERLDVWPPLIVPPEYSPHSSTNSRIDSVVPMLSEENGGKGFVADIVPQFENILGVGRMRDILRVERWRTWRIDSALNCPGDTSQLCFSGLGEALQNGFLGFLGERVSYWWDLAFANRDSVDELFDVIRSIRGTLTPDVLSEHTQNDYLEHTDYSTTNDTSVVYVFGDD